MFLPVWCLCSQFVVLLASLISPRLSPGVSCQIGTLYVFNLVFPVFIVSSLVLSIVGYSVGGFSSVPVSLYLLFFLGLLINTARGSYSPSSTLHEISDTQPRQKCSQ